MKIAPLKLHFLLIYQFIFLFITTNSIAQPLSYIDSDGRTHYVDSIEKVPGKYKNQSLSRGSPPPINKTKNIFGSNETTSSSKNNSKPQVDIYITSWCPYCRELEKFLVENKVAFKKHDIEKNSNARREYAKLGGGGIPVMTIMSPGDDAPKIIRGFDPEILDNTLNLK